MSTVSDTRLSLSPYMNSIPPSKDYFCVGTGASNRVLHPDRAPHTQLAMEGPVVLFSGAAPQQGVNFTLTAGSLVYRNQMSTLGSPEPPPQVGTAGTLRQRPWDFVLPWSEARWHPGEDIAWYGFRMSRTGLFGLPYWDMPGYDPTEYAALFDEDPEPYKPPLQLLTNGDSPLLRSSFNLQLARGTYQASAIRPRLQDAPDPSRFREPWFQARGRKAAFNLSLDTAGTAVAGPWYLAGDYFPNHLNIYPFTELALDGGRLSVNFERSATWPREAGTGSRGSEVSGVVLAESVRDEYGNVVHFDRVPKYGWETDFKVPKRSAYIHPDDEIGDGGEQRYAPYARPQAWRLPHKRLRTVRLISADQADPGAEKGHGDAAWTIAYVYEHPESDRIAVHDTPPAFMGSPNDHLDEWKSLYSHLPQADWPAGRLPGLNDETTLLTVQVYRGDPEINGARFQDDYSVWGSTVGKETLAHKRRVNQGIEYEGDRNGDGCPGICGIDDDGDGLIDEDCANRVPGDSGYGADCTDYDQDDNEDGIVERESYVGPAKFICDSGLEARNSCGVCEGSERPCRGDADCEGTGSAASCNADPSLCIREVGVCSNNPERTCDPAADPESSECATSFCSVSLLPCDSENPCHGDEGAQECIGPGDCVQPECELNGDYDAGAQETKLTGQLSNPTARASDPPGDSPGAGGPDGCPGHCDIDEDGDQLLNETSDGRTDPTAQERDPFYVFDDDEDGIYDEDGEDDPLLVHLRALSGACATGKHPFVPRSRSSQDPNTMWHATLPGEDWDDDCRPVAEASRKVDGEAADPWVYQVHYVYARSNPYWLLSARDPEPDPSDCKHGRLRFLKQPQYYYFPPFIPDLDGDAETDQLLYDAGIESGWDACPDYQSDGTVKESDLITAEGGEFAGMVIKSQDEDGGSAESDNLPNVHPDCVPDPRFRGPQGYTCPIAGSADPVEPVGPGSIHLIKRIVRARPDDDRPDNIIEKVWLYRYNDAGFLKAVFDPVAVQALIDAEPGDADGIQGPDDILKYSDTHVVAGRPLIYYASQWYTYYHPYSATSTDSGIPACFDQAPFVGCCLDSSYLDLDSPLSYLAANACDGYPMWSSEYGPEMHVDPDCSEFMHQDCGTCLARKWCASSGCADQAADCACPSNAPANLEQMGIPGAQPRFRQYLVKTARFRGDDGEMHTYRFDYLGAANGVYDDDGRITSYADAHNITIVDELVEQTECEFGLADNDCEPEDTRSEFYIYEDDFRFVLDPGRARAAGAENLQGLTDLGGQWLATSHYLYLPVKVKTRRVVVMNFYGIAISDRLILTPGFDGDQASLVENQQYELINARGQAKHIYDPSWVALLRRTIENGNPDADPNDHLEEIKTAGRVLVELFGGHEGWHSVLSGIAWGSGGGNLYDQQCKSPDVVADVPVQRVQGEQLVVARATKHFSRTPTGASEPVLDLPEVEAHYYSPVTYSDSGFTIEDPAGTIGEAACNADPEAGCSGQVAPDCGDGCYDAGDGECRKYLDDIDLHNQDPVEVQQIPGEEAGPGDGATTVNYAYGFYNFEAEGVQDVVKWKWRWEEVVGEDKGGSGKTALQVWYFDVNGRVRFHGRGPGNAPSGGNPPAVYEPFIVTYTGFDALGRPHIEVNDCDQSIESLIEDADPVKDDWAAVKNNLGLESPGQNLVTFSEFDDIGMLVSRRTGIVIDFDGDLTVDTNWEELVRTDYRILANRNITYEYTDENDGNTHIATPWRDPYVYHIVYEHVTDNGVTVNGRTTVQVMDEGGRPIEQRVIAYADDWLGGPTGRVDDFGFGVTLLDYEYDGAVNSGTFGDDFLSKYELWNCNGTGGAGGSDECYDGDQPKLVDFLTVEFPEDKADWAGYAEPGTRSIVTLERGYNLYQQASTLKPTHEIVFNSFAEAHDEENDGPDPRAVVRQYTYDLEDRIARQREPDGTVQRFLFDAKRRLTKVFKGSNDSCPNWWPTGYTGGTDDMLLLEHRLYNDGYDCREFNELPGEGAGNESYDPCQSPGIPPNDNFPNNAGMLVRTRRFTGNAESCEIPYDREAPSRDVRYQYDWRGRPVLVLEGAVGYASSLSPSSYSTLADPKFISATSTVYDNLDRPILVATWPHHSVPAVGSFGDDTGDTITGWANEFVGDYAMSSTVDSILAAGPLTLAHTLYDDRGRPYEQRTYNVDDVKGDTYEYTRTFRDDLNRVVAELSPTGFTINEYDSLGRVVCTSSWSSQPTTNFDDLCCGEGCDLNPTGSTELTRTVTTYDAFGNVLTQTHYDRQDTSETGPITPDQATGKAVITYTHNWYDAARRLAATAYYGTNADNNSYFTNGSEPAYLDAEGDPVAAPVWNCDGATPSNCSYQIGGGDTDALVTRYGYDLAGRRIWTQDGRGVVTRTWYDLMGRRLLVAENWEDFGENSAPDGTSLTPSHTGPIRYTAYHHTRGGLLDMVVAIVPDPTDPAPNLSPADIVWDECDLGSDPLCDLHATDVEVNLPDAPGVQATQYVYTWDPDPGTAAPVPNVRGEATGPGETAGPEVSAFPNLVSQIRYPDTDPGNAVDDGQPSADSTDRVSFVYTPSGQIAQRIDQRGVVLDYEYGTISENDGSDQLSAVGVHVPSSAPDHFYNPVGWIEIERDGSRIMAARSRSSATSTGQANAVEWSYDGFGNLLSETLSFSVGMYPRTVAYNWSETGQNANRLEHIIYPSGRRIELGYASDVAGDALFTRAVDLREVDEAGTTLRHFSSYTYTGGGRKIAQAWGDPTSPRVQMDHRPETSIGKPSGLDRFGRVIDLAFLQGTVDFPGNALHRYQYGYDDSGNRLFEEIRQAAAGESHDNRESYLYGYDPLDRLTFAKRGELSADRSSVTPADPPNGWAWNLDVLGNWSGDAANSASYAEINSGVAYHDVVNARNQIERRTDSGGGETVLVYDAAGNLVDDGTQIYHYDAWSRLSAVYRKSDGAIIAAYQYDPLGRRVWKKVYNSGGLDTTYDADLFHYDGNRLIEHRIAYDTTDGGGGGGSGGGGEPDCDENDPECSLGDPTAKAVGGTAATEPPGDTATDGALPQGQEPGTVDLADLTPADPKFLARASGSLYKTHREYVWGLDYIDEQVAMIFPGGLGELFDYVLQDANYNVVAHAHAGSFPSSGVRYQFRYHPYGSWTEYEIGSSGAAVDPRNTSSRLHQTHGWQGLYFDQETGLLYNRGRYTHPTLGRFLQQDPNGQALHLATAMRMNAQTPMALAGLSPFAQHDDGRHLYQYLGSQPVDRRDPSGLFFGHDEAAGLLLTRDWDDIYESVTGQASAYLGVQGAATWGAFWGENVTALPTFASGMAGVSEGFSEFADYYADQIIYLPVEGVLAGMGQFGRLAAAGDAAAAAKNARRGARATRHASRTNRYAHAVAVSGKVKRIRNAHLAGKVHPRTGVPFDADGFPDFSRVSGKTVAIQQTGNRVHDVSAANRAAGYTRTPPGYTWHHHQNGRTMQLVPSDIHQATGHTGGVALHGP